MNNKLYIKFDNKRNRPIILKYNEYSLADDLLRRECDEQVFEIFFGFISLTN